MDYNWKRFWCPRTGNINLSDGGYLSDPISEFGKILNPDVVSFETIAGVPCLILLGEPGMGKSHTLEAELKFIDTNIQAEGGQTFWLDLRSYGNEDRLVRKLFENPDFVSWINGNYQLHLFLDSLDECLLRVDTLAAILIDELKKCPIDRLNLRISCRTADWPTGLEDGLKQLWGIDSVAAYELAPLRKIDVVKAAIANEINSDEFLSEINRMEVVPLAIKPVTLGFLLNTYRQNGELPSTQAELYLRGCQILCEETNKNRRDAGRTGQFTAEQRLAVAARFAAVTVFANRNAIWTDLDLGNIPQEDISVQELCGSTEIVNGEQFSVSEAAVREATATGLFSSRGPNRMGWAHQTYAEFLAALYLMRRGMNLGQVMSLIIHPGDPEGKLVPQLHETAAWLAGMNRDVFFEIMKIDPDVLLRSDVATADVQDKAALVEALLRLFDEEKLLDDWSQRGQYGKLAHTGLADQLRPYIMDSSKGIIVRRVAIDIAEACGLETLQTELANLALAPFQPLQVREQAADAVINIGDDETKARLKLLAMSKAGDDPNDQLKGFGLIAVWPNHITAEELFSVLTEPKKESFFGSYMHFLYSDLVKHISPEDLPTALEWIKAQLPRDSLTHKFDDILDSIMYLAWEHLEWPGVLESFAKTAMSCLETHDVIAGDYNNTKFNDVLREQPNKRRKLLGAMIPFLINPEEKSILFIYSATPIALSEDVPWMIERLMETESDEIRLKFAWLIANTFDPRDPLQSGAFYNACNNSPVLAEICRRFFAPVDLDSPEAEEMRESYRKEQEWLNRRNQRRQLQPPLSIRITELLNECESGNIESWWKLNLVMTLKPDSAHYGNEYQTDITVLPGWESANTTMRMQIIEAAKKYVMEGDPGTSKWLGTSSMYRPALAGYKALRLLQHQDPSFLSIIPAPLWKRWAPTIVAYTETKEKLHNELMTLAYRYAPEEVIESLMILIDKENDNNDNIYIIRKVEVCWDDRLAKAILEKVKDKKLKPKCMGDIVSCLIDNNVDEAKAFAESIILSPPPTSAEGYSHAVIAACILMSHAHDAGWSVVWPALLQDPEFGKKVITQVAQDLEERRSGNIGLRLDENKLADLYIWLVHQFPFSEDPKFEGVHSVGSREMVADWRDAILHRLRDRGTYEACNAIHKIALELPELDWLKRTLCEAQRVTRHCTWVPLKPIDISKVACDREGRLVQNGDQLLEVIIESLGRLEAKLHGETPAVIDLWNEIKSNVYRPKDENRLSDYVKRHLLDDLRRNGIIVNREVEIRRSEGTSRGQRTDIHVNAVVREPRGELYDTVTAIIEVKGCWHSELREAMKTQLVERYLNNNQCQHGLYLIGWFNCAQWDTQDSRKLRAIYFDIDEARTYFDAQAAKLSQHGPRVKAFVMNASLAR